jgi:hypothetical protein
MEVSLTEFVGRLRTSAEFGKSYDRVFINEHL